MMNIINNILPVFALLALGRVLADKGFVPEPFFKAADKLVYYVCFPAMLFWKIGGAGGEDIFNWRLNLAVLAVVFLGYLAGMAYALVARMNAFQVGAFSQCSYRFNTYLGMAVIMSAYGEAGVTEFGVIISLTIPFINVLAVGTLIWFSSQSYSFRDKVQMVLRAMLVNPLIIACLAGMAYALLGPPFPTFFENTFRLLAAAALPLALLSIGQSLTFARVRSRLRPVLAASAVKLAFMPLVGYLILKAANIDGLSFQVAMVFFALPTATSAFILSSQLNSDAHLASAAIAASTLFSFVSLSAVMLL
jgi:hypothetical protein